VAAVARQEPRSGEEKGTTVLFGAETDTQAGKGSDVVFYELQIAGGEAAIVIW
jgi:hypothetical protein